MFFCLPYAMKPCGMYTVGHLALFLMTALLIGTGLYLCRQMSEERVRTVIRAVTALLSAAAYIMTEGAVDVQRLQALTETVAEAKDGNGGTAA